MCPKSQKPKVWARDHVPLDYNILQREKHEFSFNSYQLSKSNIHNGFNVEEYSGVKIIFLKMTPRIIIEIAI